jgi:heterodisulfide reductase subunit A
VRAKTRSVSLRYEAQNGEGVTTVDHDLVVLSLGMIPGWNPQGVCPVSADSDQFIKTIQPKLSPTLTDMEGVFVAGAAAGPKDIVDTITESGRRPWKRSSIWNGRVQSRKAVA